MGPSGHSIIAQLYPIAGSASLKAYLPLMIASILLGLLVAFGQGVTATAELRGLVQDENGGPVAGVTISLRAPDGATLRGVSDETGHFSMTRLSTGNAAVTLSKTGFFQLKDARVGLGAGVNEATFILAREQELHERIDVIAPVGSIEAGSVSQEQVLTAREIRETPMPSSHTLQNALPALPTVVQDSSGNLHVAGARSRDTQYLLDGFEAGDPVTGEFTSRINVDGVQTVTVEPGQMDARYAHPGAGVVNIETQPGDDRWRFTTTNFLPDLSFQSGVQLGNWYPRFTFSGPIIKGRLWFSDALSWQHSLEIIPELPRKQNESTRTAADNLMRLRFKLNNVHLLESSFLWNGSKNTYDGLTAFSPAPTTTTNTGGRYLVSLKDQISLGRTLIELGVARDGAETRRLPQGVEAYTFLPEGPRGNYFEDYWDHKQRWQFLGNVFLPSRRWFGAHDLQAGFKADSVRLDRDANRRSIQVLRADYSLSRESWFDGPSHLALSNVEGGLYVQDAWRVLRPLVVQLGSRLDWDRMSERVGLRPSIGLDWVPWRSGSTKFVAGYGVYSGQPDLALMAQSLDQERVDLFYPPAAISESYTPTVRRTRFLAPPDALEMPRFTTATLGAEQQLPDHTRLGVHWIRRDQHNGFIFDNAPPPETDNVFYLRNTREDRYRALDVSLAHSIAGKGEFSVDYVRSVARSNKVLEYSVLQLQGGPQASGRLGWDAPNRVVSHGSIQTNLWGLLFSYFYEYRTGFPFSVIDASDQVVGPPNQSRFPDYWNLNAAAEKRVKWRNREWAVRLAVINVTGHDNANAVINNVDSTNFGQFGGGQRRAFTARLRLVGRH
jgi:hypothetical protein